MTKHPESVQYDEARARAVAKLTEGGWVWVEEASEFRHSDGRRGRLTFIPDPGAPIDKPGDHRSMWYREVELQEPGRMPTPEELWNRVSTIPAPIPVIKFW